MLILVNATCTCDVKKYTCDLYCCCDSECDSSLIKSWKNYPIQCVDNINLGKSPIYNCIATSLLSFYKLRPGMNVTTDTYSKEYCFQSDLLSNSLNYYYNFQIDTYTTNDLNHDNLFKNMKTFSSVMNQDDTINQNSYFYGETLATHSYLTGRKSILPLPNQLGSGFCNMFRGAMFLINEKSHCISKASTSTCLNSGGSFSSFTYSKLYIYSSKGNKNSPKEITSTSARQIDTATSPYCTNAIRSVKYQIKLDSSLSIQSATVEFTYYPSNTVTINNYYPIDFSIEFIGNSNSQIISGNQGYLLNSEVLFGDASSNQIITPSFYLSDRNFKCVLSDDSDGYNKIPFKIIFGQNKIYSCSQTMVDSTYCSKNSFANLIQKVKSLGMFGNSQSGNKSSWVTINGTNDVLLQPQTIGSTCKIPLEIKLEVIISKYKNYTTINNYIAEARISAPSIQTITFGSSYTQYFNVIFKWNIPQELQPGYQPISANIASDLFMPFLVANNAEYQSKVINSLIKSLFFLFMILII